MACNQSSDFQQAISHALQQLVTLSMVLNQEQTAISKLSTICFHFAHEIQQAFFIVQRYIQ